MKKLIWKIRYTAYFCWLTHSSPRFAWKCAGAWLEMLKGDTSEDPIECADEEIEEGLRG